MNFAAVKMVDDVIGDEKLDLSLKRAAKGLLAASLAVAVPLGGLAVYDAHQINQTDTLSGSLETVAEAQMMTRAAHAGGVASGLLVGGVHVPQELIDRIDAMVEADIVNGSSLLSSARLDGVEAALSGGWNTERLEAYVDRIEAEDPALGGLIMQGAERLSATGFPDETARTFLRAMTVRLMSGEAPEAFEAPRRLDNGLEASRMEILREMQAQIVTRLEETNRVGGLDPNLTRDMAITLVARTLEDAPAPDGPGL